MNGLRSVLVLLWVAMLAGCAAWAPQDVQGPHAQQGQQGPKVSAGGTASRPLLPDSAREVVLGALDLLDTGYRFGGKNPEAGLDCSGMVNLVFERATRRRLGSSAADIARNGRPVSAEERQPGDLVFFNTRGSPHSHVGIYLGDARFIHAPSSQGKVRIDRLDSGWFAARITEQRRYIE